MNRWLMVFFGIEGHVAIDRNPGPRNNILLLRLFQGISKELVTIYSSIHYPACYTFGLQCQTPIQTPACQGGGGAVCAIFIMVFGITRLEREPTTYHTESDTLTTNPS